MANRITERHIASEGPWWREGSRLLNRNVLVLVLLFLWFTLFLWFLSPPVRQRGYLLQLSPWDIILNVILFL